MLSATLKEFFSYLRHPWLCSKNVPKNMWDKLIAIWFISFIPSFAVGLSRDELINTGWLPEPGALVYSHDSINSAYIFFGSLLVAPVVEEIIFRAQLKSLKYSYLFISIAAGAILLNFINPLLALLFGAIMYFGFHNYHSVQLSKSIGNMDAFWKRYFPYHFYFTALCFSIMHIYLYDNGGEYFKISLLYTMPQFIIGLSLGYVRMQYGLRYAIVLHAAHNFLPAVILMISLGS